MAPLPHLLLARYTYTICLLFCGVLLIFPATNALRPPSSLLPTTAFHTAHYGRTQTGTSKYSIGHTQKIHKYRDRYDELFACEETSALFRVRGGDNRDGQPGAVINIWEKAKNTYTDILPGTRLHLSLILITTAAHLIGLPAPLLFSLPVSLSPSHLLQLWRPFTAVSYLGVPSMSMANNLYFLLKFGQALEASTGSATHVWFLLTQTAMLTALGRLGASLQNIHCRIYSLRIPSHFIFLLLRTPFQQPLPSQGSGRFCGLLVEPRDPSAASELPIWSQDKRVASALLSGAH